MSNLVIALLFALGASGWIFSKMSRRAGGEMKPVIIVTGSSFLLLFLVVWSILDTFAS